MHFRSLAGVILPGLLIQACSSLNTVNDADMTSLPHTAGLYGSIADAPETGPDQDHFIAWIPRQMAQTAAVAEALAQVEWGNAREQAGTRLCAGQWLASGAVTGRIGPYPATAPDRLGGYSAWYYRVSHKPGIRGCAGHATQDIYAAVQSNLPDWIIIRTAGSDGTANNRDTVSLLK